MPVPVAPDPHAVDDATIMQRVRAGLNFVEIGLRLGVSPHRVARIAKAHGYDSRKRIRLTAKLRADQKARAKAVRAFKRAQAAAEEARRMALRGPKQVSPVTGRLVEHIRVPAEYRAAGLAEDYRDLCRDFGMVEGERRCRRLLAETTSHCRTLAAEARLSGEGGRG